MSLEANPIDIHRATDAVLVQLDALLFKLISSLQFSGTVPMIDIEAYAKWLIK